MSLLDKESASLEEVELGSGQVLVPAGPRVNQSHPACPQPPNEEMLVWRYMDLARFIDLLATKRLALPRLDQFRDKFEGSVPDKYYEGMDRDAWVVSVYPSYSIRGSNRQELAKQTQMLCYATYASCWRLDNFESVAMWERWCSGGNGLAVALSYARLAASANYHQVFIGCVRYIDYATETFPDWQWKNHAFMHKRREFSDEREVRIIYHANGWAGADGRRSVGKHDLDAVAFIPWNAEELIERVILSPDADKLTESAVVRSIGAFAPRLADKVVTSRLRGLPVY